MEDTTETLYSQEDILTYIGFARQFKPQLTVVSKKKMYIFCYESCGSIIVNLYLILRKLQKN
jgi:hypothetical protein